MKQNPFRRLYARLSARFFKNKSPAELKQAIHGEIKDAMPVVKDRFQQATELVQVGVNRVLPRRDDTPENRYYKILGLSFVGLMGIGVLAGFASFLLTLRSPESVAVPQAVGLDLVQAIDGIQEFGLVPRIEQQPNPDPATKGKIVAQNPPAGVTVRVGREVTLTISTGVSADKLANYIGRNVEDVRQEILAQYGADSQSLQVGDVAYTFDESDPGTIISQDPPAGAELAGMRVKLLVSRGKDAGAVSVPDLKGQEWDKAMAALQTGGIPFACEIGGGGKQGTVAAQKPSPGEVLSAGQRVTVTITPPESDGKRVFGIYEINLPDYAAGVTVAVAAVSAGGSTPYANFLTFGGRVTFPYYVEADTELVVSVQDKEVGRRTVKAK